MADGRWWGRTVACIASGPSLTLKDCEQLREAGVPAIVTNNTWQRAPWADVLYAGDYQWWRRYRAGCTFEGERWTCSARAASEFDLRLHKAAGGYNSGMRAMQLARDFGAARIIMLGYDNGLMPGSVEPHWHGKHEVMPKGGDARVLLSNPDRGRFVLWGRLFERLARELRKIEVVNCSRHTTLSCFPRAPLEQALC